jgi:3-oxoacyl-[acyl-carrier protein] reductase
MNPADGTAAAGMNSPMALGRYARGDEIAGLVAYLAGPEAGLVTGPA